MPVDADARKSNCNVTFSDNYDDAYKSSPAWDPKLIARRPDGDFGRAAIGPGRTLTSSDGEVYAGRVLTRPLYL